MLQRRRTDIKANNATIRRQMNPQNALRFKNRGEIKGQEHVVRNRIYLIVLGLFLSSLYYYHEGGDINERKQVPVLPPKTVTVVQSDDKGDIPISIATDHDHADVSPLQIEKENESVVDIGEQHHIVEMEDQSQYHEEVSPEAGKDLKSSSVESKSESNAEKSSKHGDWRSKIDKVKEEFYMRYGGKREALDMLKRGIFIAADTEEHSVHHTAERIVRAVLREQEEQSEGEEPKRNKFTMSFGGYSVTVGRGNYFHQSYPFVIEKILKPLFEESLHLDLVVRNSAIGGIPSFPYGWCLPNFLGEDSDVISWDYGMNEGNGAEALEAYLRQSLRNLPKRPMMIILDTKQPRIDLLKAYYKNGILTDSIAVARGEIVNKDVLQKDEKDRPIGLQNWDKWGSPPGSPGQSRWHPKYMEHEMIGWNIAMHFIDAIEAALTMLDSMEKFNNLHLPIKDENHESLTLLPPPITGIPKGDSNQAVTHILHGVKLEENDESSLWHMDRVSCRTNFLPNIKGHMSEIIVSGTASEIGDDLMEKTDEQYQSGWVLDVGKVERDTKRKVAKVGDGGLGYIDMKLALYAIPESGTLKLSLPYEGPTHKHKHDHDSDMKAPHWFEALVFCEVNEKRTDQECKTEEDLTFIVGGVKSPSVTKITSVASYLKKAICVNVEIPKDAVVTKVNTSGEEDTGLLAPESDTVQLSIEITVTGKHVNRRDGACSISHAVWQSH